MTLNRRLISMGAVRMMSSTGTDIIGKSHFSARIETKIENGSEVTLSVLLHF